MAQPLNNDQNYARKLALRLEVIESKIREKLYTLNKHLLQWEARNKTNHGRDDDREKQQCIGVTSNRQNNRQGQKQKKRRCQYDKKDLACFLCKKKGHYARECKNMRCYKCGDLGHLSKKCRGNFQKVLLSSPYKTTRTITRLRNVRDPYRIRKVPKNAQSMLETEKKFERVEEEQSTTSGKVEAQKLEQFKELKMTPCVKVDKIFNEVNKKPAQLRVNLPHDVTIPPLCQAVCLARANRNRHFEEMESGILLARSICKTDEEFTPVKLAKTNKEDKSKY